LDRGPAARAEAGIEDVAVDRAETETEADREEVVVGRLELTPLEEDLFERRLAFGQEDLVVDSRSAAGKIEVETLPDPDRELAVKREAVLLEVVKIMGPVERRADRPPRLLEFQGDIQRFPRVILS
jgi:hypothetical protein